MAQAKSQADPASFSHRRCPIWAFGRRRYRTWACNPA